MKQELDKPFLAKQVRRTGFLDPRFNGFWGSKNGVSFFRDLEQVGKQQVFPGKQIDEGNCSRAVSIYFLLTFPKQIEFCFSSAMLEDRI